MASLAPVQGPYLGRHLATRPPFPTLLITFLLMRPGRMRAGSSFSGWLVVMITMRLGVSTTPSSTLRRPAHHAVIRCERR